MVTGTDTFHRTEGKQRYNIIIHLAYVIEWLLCATFFYLLAGKKNNTGTSKTGWLAKFGWILTYLKIRHKMSLMRFLPVDCRFG